MGRGRSFPEALGQQPYNHNENTNNYFIYSVLPSAAAEELNGRTSGKDPAPESGPRLLLDSELLSNLLFPSFLYSLLGVISSSAFSTATSYAIVENTVTSTRVIKCLPRSVFSVENLRLMTLPCRSGRDAIEHADLLDQDGTNQESWSDQQLEGTAMSLEALHGRRHVRDQPEIASSKDDSVSIEQALVANAILRRGRLGRPRVTTKTLTSHKFVAVNLTVPYSVAENYQCLPADYMVCI